MSHIDTVPACDRQTDGFTVASRALCIASYADALQKLPILAAPLRFVIFCAVNPAKFVQTLSFRHYSSLGTILSLSLRARVHSVTHSQLWKPQHTYMECHPELAL